MKVLAGLLVLSGCVADVAGGHVGPPMPAPAGERQGQEEPQDEESSSQNTVTASGYLEQIAMIQCAEAFTCRSTYPGEAAGFEAVWKASVPACVANLIVAWNANAIETEIAKGRINFDGTAAVSCLSGVAFGTCDAHWTEGIQWAQACYSVMVGRVPVGEGCESVYACTSYNCDTVEHRCI